MPVRFGDDFDGAKSAARRFAASTGAIMVEDGADPVIAEVAATNSSNAVIDPNVLVVCVIALPWLADATSVAKIGQADKRQVSRPSLWLATARTRTVGGHRIGAFGANPTRRGLDRLAAGAETHGARLLAVQAAGVARRVDLPQGRQFITQPRRQLELAHAGGVAHLLFEGLTGGRHGDTTLKAA